jgi:hypothetical protein
VFVGRFLGRVLSQEWEIRAGDQRCILTSFFFTFSEIILNFYKITLLLISHLTYVAENDSLS